MSRHSEPLTGQLVVLIGGDGYFGTHIAQELLTRGARLRVVSRHPEKAFKLKPLGNLGSLQSIRADITRFDTHAGLVAGASAVVNLAGAFTGDLDRLHVQAAGSLAAAAAAAGVTAFVQVSANGADHASPVDYARTKAEGERAVLAAFPRGTILRPSVIFGSDDQFINMFAGLIAMAPVLPVFAPEARLQPVFVDDAAIAVAHALGDPDQFGGRTFELVGPEPMTMLALNERIAGSLGRKRLFVPLPDAIAGLIAALPLTPISRDQLALLKAGNVSSGLPGLAELGIAARPLDLFLDRWLVRYRAHGRFGDKHAPAN